MTTYAASELRMGGTIANPDDISWVGWTVNTDILSYTQTLASVNSLKIKLQHYHLARRPSCSSTMEVFLMQSTACIQMYKSMLYLLTYLPTAE